MVKDETTNDCHGPGMTADLKDWTREIYRGRGSARVGLDRRVVLRARPDPSELTTCAPAQTEEKQ